MNVSQPPSPTTPRLSQWAHGANGHSSKQWSIYRGSEILPSPFQGWSVNCWWFSLPLGTNADSLISYRIWDGIDQSDIWWQVDYIDLFSAWERDREAVTYLHWNRYGFSFSSSYISASNTVYEIFVYYHIPPFNVASTKEARERDVYRFHWPHHVSPSTSTRLYRRIL